MTKRENLVLVAGLVVSLQLAACGSDVGNQVLIFTGSPDDNGADAADAGTSQGDAGAPDASVDQLADRGAGRADASPDQVVDAATREAAADLPTAHSLLAAQTPECTVCAAINCPNLINGCDSISGTARFGPGGGTAKSELCAEALGCALSTGCSDFASCYCGQAPGGIANGACRAPFQRALGSTVAATAYGSISDYSNGGGWAMSLVECLMTYCGPAAMSNDPTRACLVPPPSDAGDSGSDGGSAGAPPSTEEEVLVRCGAIESKREAGAASTDARDSAPSSVDASADAASDAASLADVVPDQIDGSSQRDAPGDVVPLDVGPEPTGAEASDEEEATDSAPPSEAADTDAGD